MTRSQAITERDPASGVYVSKRLIAAFAVAGALALGWLVNDFVGDVAAALSGSPASSAWGSPVSSEIAPVTDDPAFAANADPVGPSASQLPASQPPASETSPSSPTEAPATGATNVYLTIVNGQPGASTTPTITATTAPPERSGQNDETTIRANAASPPAPYRRSQGRMSGPSGRLRATSGTGTSATPTNLVVGRRAVMVPNAPSSPRGMSTRGPAGGMIVQLSPQSPITAMGEHIVIAYDGSIVYVGDHGSMTANSGDAIGGGTVALDADRSTFSSNYDPTVIVPNGGSPPASTGTRAASASPASGGVLSGSPPGAIPRDASPLVSAFISYTGNRTADIAGFEDHSILTRGTGNVVTYDDSNVFMNRNGKINANTGDTDSAGLNAIATLRSRVTAGPHCDDGCDDESIIQAQAGVFDEGDVAVDGNGNVVWAPDAADESASDDDSEDDSLPADNGDDSDAADDESDDGDVSDPAEPAETRQEADSTRQAADNGPEVEGQPGPGALIVGGDGIDDLSERVDGNFNVSTYDDSNVVIGGNGAVNAQIGDSDTGGTVTMDTTDSVVSGGNSR